MNLSSQQFAPENLDVEIPEDEQRARTANERKRAARVDANFWATLPSTVLRAYPTRVMDA